MIVTVYLIVLILALLFGNIFLSITEPKKKPMHLVKQTEAPVELVEPVKSVPVAKNSMQLKNLPSSPETRIYSEKINLAHKRIDSLEKLLLKLNTSEFVGKKLNSLNLVKKLNDLTDFKREAIIEIQALKDRLAEINGKKEGLQEKENFFSNPKVQEKIHDLIYHSKHK